MSLFPGNRESRMVIPENNNRLKKRVSGKKNCMRRDHRNSRKTSSALLAAISPALMISSDL